MIDTKTIYLDFQASTPISAEAISAMQPYLTELYGNPHSNDHIKGWEANKAVENSRLKVAVAIGADANEIIFTSGATESNNLAIKGLEKHLQNEDKTTILVSSIEHKCILETSNYMKERGFNVKVVQPDENGIIKPSTFKDAMDDDVGLASIMFVNNEIGTIQPIEELTEIAHRHGALFHTDAAQAPAFMGLDVRSLNVDLMSLSSHKAYGPKGIGALYIASDRRDLIQPLIHGGGQENGLRSGTLPTALCVGFSEALGLLSQSTDQNTKALKRLADRFWQQIKSQIPNASINGDLIFRHPGNLNILFPDVDAKDFLQALQPSVAASTGSACNSGVENPSYVLAEIGLDRIKASSSIRFSFGINQSIDEVEEAARIICETYKNTLEINHAA
ncbi:MAG: cysteine desulfurase family protein [Pseudomonadota bacterium]